MKLMKDRVIPEEYRDWYTNLPSSDTARDCLPAPSADEPEPESIEGDNWLCTEAAHWQ